MSTLNLNNHFLMLCNEQAWKLDPCDKYNHASPRKLSDACGFIPNFFAAGDERPAKEQLRERYPFFMDMPMTDWVIHENGSIEYPEDPLFWPYAETTLILPNEMIRIYPNAWTMIKNLKTGATELHYLD